MCGSPGYPIKTQCERLYHQFKWTSKVCVNHNIDSWWNTYWYVILSLIDLFLTTRYVTQALSDYKPLKFWAPEKIKSYHSQVYFPVFFSCFTAIFISCRHSFFFGFYFYSLSLCLVVIIIMLAYSLTMFYSPVLFIWLSNKNPVWKARTSY